MNHKRVRSRVAIHREYLVERHSPSSCLVGPRAAVPGGKDLELGRSAI